jgi:diguanylate cyclase (GGDEF)-like protein
MEDSRIAKYIRSRGRLETVIVVTAISVISSVGITSFIMSLISEAPDTSIFLPAIAAPLIIAPLVSWHIVGLLLYIFELEAKQRTLASFDYLTEIFNRRYFLTESNRLLEESKVKIKSFSVAMLDLDEFKLINDTYGHEAGDIVLKSFADILRKYSNDVCITGRLGGEEFAVCISGSQLKDVTEQFNEIKIAVANSHIQYQKDTVRFSISIGLVHVQDTSNVDLSSLLASADRALYKAKSAGRNRIELAGS